MVADCNCHYVIVTGSINNNALILANVYAPNYDDDCFFVKFLSLIQNIESHCLIISGGFNCCLNQMLDRSSSEHINASRSSCIINTFLSDYGISDIWRHLNLNTHEYSSVPSVHHTFSR